MHNRTDAKFYLHSDAATVYINNQTVSNCVPSGVSHSMLLFSQIDAYPGQVFGLSVTIKDALNKTIGATVRFEDTNPINVKDSMQIRKF